MSILPDSLRLNVPWHHCDECVVGAGGVYCSKIEQKYLMLTFISYQIKKIANYLKIQRLQCGCHPWQAEQAFLLR